MAVPAMRMVARSWWREYIRPLLPVSPEGQSLVLRVAVLSAAITDQAVQLSEAIAREMEADSFLGAAAAGRSQLERIGLLAYAREHLTEATGDTTRLEALTTRFLFASKSLDTGEPVLPTGKLIEAAHAQLGGDFRGDYAYLSDLTHPNAPIVWSPDLVLGSQHGDGLAVTEERAELLLKLVGAGVHAVAHNAIQLIEWAVAHDVFLTSRLQTDQPT